MKINWLRTPVICTLLGLPQIIQAQWTIEEISPGFSIYNTQDVIMLDERVMVGAVAGQDPESLDFELYQSSDLGDSWEMAHELSGAQSLYLRNFEFVNNNLGFASCSAVPGYYADPEGGYQYILKTTDGGTTWEMNHAIVSAHSFEYVSDIRFFDENNGIIGGSFDKDGEWFETNALVLITSNGGTTWESVDLPIPDGSLRTLEALDVAGDNTVYAVLQDDWETDNTEKQFYIYKSTDKGATWEEISAGLFPELMLETDGDLFVTDCDFVSEETGWMTFRESKTQSYIYKTVNGGIDWEVIDHPIKESAGMEDVDFNAVLFLNESEGFVAGGNFCNDLGCFRGHSLIYTNDGGENWDIIKYDTGNPDAFMGLDFDFDEGVGFVVGGGIALDNGGIFRFSNASLGVEDELPMANFAVYPNPSTNGQITVRSEESQVTVYTLDGQFQGAYTLINKELALNLAPGIYLIQSGNQVEKVTILK